SQVGQAVANAGGTLGTALSTGPVEQVTQQLSSTVVPLTSQVTTTTQTLGNATGLGAPATNLLQTVGGTVANVGTSITGTNAPVVS
ncbi:collagen-like triple helix repeat-containing protein, partial [Vibrio harveyi]